MREPKPRRADRSLTGLLVNANEYPPTATRWKSELDSIHQGDQHSSISGIHNRATTHPVNTFLLSDALQYGYRGFE